MTKLRHHLQHFGIALAAMAGMLSIVGEVSACSDTASRAATRSCCTANVASCCCESPGTKTTDVSPVENNLSVPFAPCECRPGVPSDPAQKPGLPAPERRSDQYRSNAVKVTFEVRSAIVLIRIAPPTLGPPGSPLYLRTSRLLL